MRKYFKALVRVCYKEHWDPILQCYKYIHIETDQTTLKKPLLLGEENFDPTDVSIWTTDQVRAEVIATIIVIKFSFP